MRHTIVRPSSSSCTKDTNPGSAASVANAPFGWSSAVLSDCSSTDELSGTSRFRRCVAPNRYDTCPSSVKLTRCPVFWIDDTGTSWPSGCTRMPGRSIAITGAFTTRPGNSVALLPEAESRTKQSLIVGAVAASCSVLHSMDSCHTRLSAAENATSEHVAACCSVSDAGTSGRTRNVRTFSVPTVT